MAVSAPGLVGFTPNSASQELADVQQVFINTFGSGVNLTPTTINGVFIQELTNRGLQVEAAKTNLYSYVYDPDVAAGVYLDGLGAWLSINRKAAVQSVVTCQVTGLSGTTIPANSQILNTNGDVFYNPNSITIIAGVGSGEFKSLVAAPIPCTAGTLNRIVQQLAGWDTVNNATDGITGTNAQTDYSYRNTIKYAKGLNSSGTFNSVNSALLDTADVIDFFLVENYTNSPISKNGVTVSPHSIYLSVYGGTQQEIASILYTKRSAGCGMDGDTTYAYTDPNFSWVTEDMTWQTAIDAPVQLNISIISSDLYPVDIVSQIQNACVNNFNNGIGTIPPARMGVAIYASRFYSSLANLGVSGVTNLTIQTVTAGTPALVLDLPITEAPTLIAANVLVTVI